ncbi:MAG: DUF881 domain-containing protein [Nocardioides sp.]
MPDPTRRPEPPVIERTTGRTGRQRLWDAFFRPSAGQFVVAVLLAAVGFSAVTQVRANELDNTYAGYREQDLIDVLTALSGASQRAEGELARLENARRDLRSVTSRRETALTEAKQSLDTYNILAGLVPVTGPGIRITVSETEGEVALATMIDTVQELRNAGAESMVINGEVRVIAETAFEDGVGGLEVGGRLLSSPYVIDVIGEPSTLRSGMIFLRGPVDQLEDDGATVDIQEFSSLDITAVRNPVRPEFAQPDE